MKIKKSIHIMLIATVCTVLLSITAFANERAISCGNCSNGKYLTITRNEEEVFVLPCTHGFGTRKDYLIREFRNTYNECNECHYGYLVKSVLVSQFNECIEK